MHHFYKFFSAVLIGICVGTLADAVDSTPPPNTGVGETFALKTQVLAGGGQRATGAVFELTGTLAQSTAGPNPIAVGGNFALRGGFHSKAAPLANAIFHDGFEN